MPTVCGVTSCVRVWSQVPYPVEQIITQDVPFTVEEIVEKIIERTVCMGNRKSY